MRFTNHVPSIFDRFFESDLFDWSNRNFSLTNTTLPSVNIKETDDAFHVEVAAPGLEKGDFKIEMNEDQLVIRSEKKRETESKEGEQFTKREFSYQSFCRSFTLPHYTDESKIEASYDNGILKVIIPKKEEAKPRPTRIIEIR